MGGSRAESPKPSPEAGFPSRGPRQDLLTLWRLSTVSAAE